MCMNTVLEGTFLRTCSVNHNKDSGRSGSRRLTTRIRNAIEKKCSTGLEHAGLPCSTMKSGVVLQRAKALKGAGKQEHARTLWKKSRAAAQGKGAMQHLCHYQEFRARTWTGKTPIEALSRLTHLMSTPAGYLIWGGGGGKV